MISLQDAKSELKRVRKIEVVRYLNNGAIWKAKNDYLYRVTNGDGDGLKGLWTDFADLIIELVAYGIVDKSGWRLFFEENLPEPGDYSDIEARAAAMDSDQKKMAINGLANIMRILSVHR